MKNNSQIKLTYFIIAILAWIIYYISWFQSSLNFLLSLSIYTLFFYLIHYIWVRMNKTIVIPFPQFMNYFLWKASLFILFIILLILWLSYLSNSIFPATMPEYTITNWVKTVKFQAMSHIATQKFYNNVKSNLIKYKKEWWVYFYEWVKPGTKENTEKFNNAIWVKFDKNLYANFSKLYWVTNQDNREFLWLVNNLDFNVDINIDEIVKLYEQKILTKKSTEYKNKVPLDVNKVIIETLSNLNEKEVKILVYINQAILNFIISNDTTKNFLTDKFSNKDLFDVILWERNKVIVNAIDKSKYKKIYMTYWLLHFKWVLKLLQEKDSKWKIISTSNLYPIKK